jgi:hypothetical protein
MLFPLVAAASGRKGLSNVHSLGNPAGFYKGKKVLQMGTNTDRDALNTDDSLFHKLIN